jgi:hypothetical protein
MIEGGNSGDEDVVQAGIEAVIPQSDCFHRTQPAELEGPAGNWELARTAINYGCALLLNWSTVRKGSELRDTVLRALLRRLLVTAEGVVTLLSHGLLEPAIGTSRTILDIELSLALILRDPSGKMARRLAAYHYLTYQEHGQDMLSNPPTRAGTVAPGGRLGELVQISKSYARFLEAQVFDDVRDDVKKDKYWHGYPSAEDAFKAVQQDADYFMQYDSATWLVHAVNVDWDFIEKVESTVHMKPLVERDPKVIQMHLGYHALRVVTACRLLVDEFGLPPHEHFERRSTVRFPDGSTVEIDSLTALTQQLVGTFGKQGLSGPDAPAS